MKTYTDGWLNAYPETFPKFGKLTGVVFVFHPTKEQACKHQSADILYRVHVRLKEGCA